MPSLGGSGGRGFWRSPAAGSVDWELLLGPPDRGGIWRMESEKVSKVPWFLGSCRVDKAGLLSAGHLSLAKQKGIMSL